jgi:hypothetical protein
MPRSREAGHALGYQQLTVSTAAIAPTVPKGARIAYMRLEVAANTVRFRDDGVDPQAGTGFLVDTGVPFWFEGNLNALKFIRAAAADGVVDIAYYA